MSRQQMTRADAAWLHMDRRTNLMVVNSVLWFDEPMDVARGREVIGELMVERFPRFRQRSWNHVSAWECPRSARWREAAATAAGMRRLRERYGRGDYPLKW